MNTMLTIAGTKGSILLGNLLHVYDAKHWANGVGIWYTLRQI